MSADNYDLNDLLRGDLPSKEWLKTAPVPYVEQTPAKTARDRLKRHETLLMETGEAQVKTAVRMRDREREMDRRECRTALERERVAVRAAGSVRR